MTKTELLEQIVEKQDELINIYHQECSILADNKNTEVVRFIGLKKNENKLIKELSDLKKQLEECEEDKYCICSYPRPHTYGGGTKQLCITCNKWINTKINE